MQKLKEIINGTSPWVGALIGAFMMTLIAYATAEITFLKGAVTRNDVSSMIRIESPYVKDQKLILETLSDLKDDLKTLLHQQRQKGNP